jgi:hypothetical protein
MEIEPTLRPESIVSDFEISAINAINEVFPNAQITGCMFHLAQNLWKKIQKTHLVECYRENNGMHLLQRLLQKNKENKKRERKKKEIQHAQHIEYLHNKISNVKLP